MSSLSQLTKKYSQSIHFALLTLVYIGFNSWFLRTNFIYHDEGMILQYASRISLGEKPYLDFHAQVTPGTFWINSIALKIYDHAISGRILTLLFGLFTLLISYGLIAKLWSPRVGFLAVLPTIFWGFLQWNFPYYSWDAAFFCICGVAILAKCDLFSKNHSNNLWPTALAGLFVGTGFLFKQNIGLIVALILGFTVLVTVFFRGRRKLAFYSLAAFTAGVIIPIAILFIYFSAHGLSPTELINVLFINGAKNKGGLLKVISYVIPHYQGPKTFLVLGAFITSALCLGAFFSNFVIRHQRILSGLVTLIPLSLFFLLIADAPEAAWEKGYYYSFYLLIGLLCFHFGNGFRNETFPRVVVFAGALSILLANTMAGPSFARLIVSNILAVPILLAICFRQVFERSVNLIPQRLMHGCLLILVGFFAWSGLNFKEQNGIFFRLLPMLSKQTAQLNINRLEGMRLDQPQAEIIGNTVSDIQKYTKPSDPIYVFFGLPFLYYVSERPNQYFYDFLWWDITSQSDVNRLFKSMEVNPPKLIVATRTLDILGNSNNKYVDSELTPALDKFMAEDYQLLKRNGAIELWLRKDHLQR